MKVKNQRIHWHSDGIILKQIVAGKKMKDHLRFAIAYWHSFCGDGSDPFGNATRIYPWKDARE